MYSVMKKILQSALLLMLSLPVAFAQNTIIEPQIPHPGDQLNITYDPSGTDISGADKIFAVAYLVEKGTPEAVEIDLVESEDGWTGSVQTTSQTKAVFFKYATSEKSDGNRRVFECRATHERVIVNLRRVEMKTEARPVSSDEDCRRRGNPELTMSNKSVTHWLLISLLMAITATVSVTLMLKSAAVFWFQATLQSSLLFFA